MKKVLMGNHAVSYGVMLSRAQVIAAYPITPQTHIVEELSEICADGRLNAHFIKVESEHSAMACCMGASAAGARAFTATSSQGLALMHEVLHWTAGSRLPIVMANVNRALGAPWNIFSDQGDTLAQRDTGWIQLYCESNQEVLDTVIQLFRICEHPDVLLPGMIVLDAFFLSHTYEIVDIPGQDEVDHFLPPYRPLYRLDADHPRTFGSMAMSEHYMEMRHNMQRAMDNALALTRDVDGEFADSFGRGYGVIEPYRCQGAEAVMVTSGTIASTARIVVDGLREEGKRVGMLKIKLFRPFPAQDIREALEGVARVGVIDRNISFGSGGGFAQELRAALYNKQGGRPPVFGFVAGLGGRDVRPTDIRGMFEKVLGQETPESDTEWVGVTP